MVPAPAEPTNAGTSSGRVTTKEIRQVIELLRHTIDEQTTLIQATRIELKQVKNNQDELQTQNEKLHGEVQALRTQIEGLRGSSAARSWAAVAADTNQFEPRKTRRHTDKEKNCVRISTRQSPDDSPETENNVNTFGRYLSTSTANTHIRTALSNAASTRDVGEMAHNNKEWLNELGNDTRLVIPRFGAVVHHTPTDGLDVERDKAGAIKKITEENNLPERGFRIEDITWLKKRDKALGVFGSLGIWFDSAEGARWMTEDGLLLDERYTGRVEKCEIKKKRCFRCQRFGHLAWSCQETPRCGHCAGTHLRARCLPGVQSTLPGLQW
ncbi:zinc knuckle domain protein [Penicillium cinerascens]|uniref:Zinc knuckle domain protein n=1 Tax=Penicillium cinerascens TaxID=70096 RepID=A0A9W9NA52_9EURO|nr:zinc knuckle domain protein [Penicillium cinerascens]KAJ5215273.1 zinc knuckle domain protein [Penicillium cinerascens]